MLTAFASLRSKMLVPDETQTQGGAALALGYHISAFQACCLER